MQNLLETIVNDPRLAQRLAEMPSDAKTVTLDLSAATPDFQHPAWSDSRANDGDNPADSPNLFETHSENTTDSIAPVAEGFVPPRKVVPFGTFDRAIGESAEYRLVGKLGSGGTGIVYQAHQRAIDREVAVKVLRDDLARDPTSRQRFLSEARVIGSLDHPNVIALHDLCIDDEGRLFYSMKRIDGTSWDQQIGEKSVEENLTILLRVADAIRYAHSRGLIHRDIKPENVMLGRFGEVLVADWGLALSHSGADDDSSTLAMQSAIGGTPAYMAPELASGDTANVTLATDIYLLGAVLFEILTGQPPHTGSNLLECIRSASRNEIIPTDVQGELMDVAMQAMATLPQDRFTTVEAFSSALTDHRTHQESERLVRRATRRVWPKDEAGEASPDEEADPYKRFGTGEALLREALEMWPENRRANETLQRLHMDLARTAARLGDLDLALRVYESAGEGQSEAAARVRKDLEHRESVRDSHAKYSTLFTYSPDAGLLIRWDDGVVMEANKSCLEMLGYEKDDLVGKQIAELDIWACPDRRKLFVDQLGQDGRVDNFETRFFRNSAAPHRPVCDQRDSESERPLLDVLISSRTVNVGGEEMLLSTFRDITERRNAERRLDESRRRLRDLQQLAGLGTWSFDPSSQQIRWSDETFRVVGRNPKRSEPDFEEFQKMIHPSDQDVLFEAINRALETGASYHVSFRMVDDDGNYRPLLTRGQPVLDEAGQTIELYGILMPTSM